MILFCKKISRNKMEKIVEKMKKNMNASTSKVVVTLSFRNKEDTASSLMTIANKARCGLLTYNAWGVLKGGDVTFDYCNGQNVEKVKKEWEWCSNAQIQIE